MKTSIENFWEKVEKSDHCWLWKGAKSASGYGTAGCVRLIQEGRLPAYACRVTQVHRIAYQLCNGRHLTQDEHIDHLCKNRICVNPAHLEAVSQMENNKRTDDNPRNGWGYRTACSRGHVYTKESVRMASNGNGTFYRDCRICKHEHYKNRR